mmetsp:Transcript_49380/g.123809  ORF Transcript_49380/g.123809 Transcript_49380/m.123809 type:complete len:205 (-) Transcript_49380:1176-1790(-)
MYTDGWVDSHTCIYVDVYVCVDASHQPNADRPMQCTQRHTIHRQLTEVDKYIYGVALCSISSKKDRPKDAGASHRPGGFSGYLLIEGMGDERQIYIQTQEGKHGKAFHCTETYIVQCISNALHLNTYMHMEVRNGYETHTHTHTSSVCLSVCLSVSVCGGVELKRRKAKLGLSVCSLSLYKQVLFVCVCVMYVCIVCLPAYTHM